MSKKVGILTINGDNNYGNRLQNYALQEVLNKFDLEVITVVNKSLESRPPMTRKDKFVNYLSYTPIEIMETVLNKKDLVKKQKKNTKSRAELTADQKAKIDSATSERYSNFMSFNSNFIDETDYFITEEYLPENKLKAFDFFVTGSDQVWNPHFRGGSFTDFLTFAPENKRVAYAASFGVDEIPRRYRESYSKWLNEMAHISVREEAGSKIVKELTGREVPVLVDPTLLLTESEWGTVMNENITNKIEQPYLLTYFLGGPSPELKSKLDKFARTNGMKVINLGVESDLDAFVAGPSEFLAYVKNARAMFTDSFHGVAFSMIFETPFLVYRRLNSGTSMYSRIETVLSKFGFEDRKGENFNGDLFGIDFSDSKRILFEEHRKSKEYFIESMRLD